MDLIDLSTRRGSTEDFEDFLRRLCARLGVDYASYATVDPVSGAVQGYATYGEAWKRHYTDHRLHLIDPTLHKPALSIAPVDWSRFDRDDRFRKVFDAARAFGVAAQGITVPIRGPWGDRGLLSVTAGMSDHDWRLLTRQIVGDLQMAAVHLHDAVMRSGLLLPQRALPQLSAREREVLQWVAAGKNQQDVGDILGISIRTVEVHLRSAREKLGALTTVQAVGRAVAMGLIHPR